MTQIIAWSHSRKNTYLECPKMFNEQNIVKSVKYEQGAPQIEGVRVHKVLEQRLVHKIPLLGKDAKFEPVVKVVEGLPGLTYGERDFCLNAQLKPTGYFDKDAWCRVTIDVINLQLDRKYGYLFDWKNGKITIDEEQLELYAAVGFIFFPDIDTFETKYIFVEQQHVHGKVYTRDQLPDLWRRQLVVPVAIQHAADTNNWPARPSRKCGYCTVNKYGKCAEAGERYRGS